MSLQPREMTGLQGLHFFRFGLVVEAQLDPCCRFHCNAFNEKQAMVVLCDLFVVP
jgi:hypothetical protein